ncbi:MAG: hypothetical protein NZ959_09845, partial [Armatimonadetes bacterium]|nr:hypothetical protein [Armatimonadota bacterium]MDW8122768.1 hypothetical protein [Armatimonadota bacterium]
LASCVGALLSLNALIYEAEILHEEAVKAARLWVASLKEALSSGSVRRKELRSFLLWSDRSYDWIGWSVLGGGLEAEQLKALGQRTQAAAAALLHGGGNPLRAEGYGIFGFRQSPRAFHLAAEASAQARLLEEKAKEKKEKVEKGLISAYHSRLRALEQKTPPRVSQGILTYHLRVDDQTLEEVRKKVPLGASAIIIAFAKARRLSPVALADQLNFSGDWIATLCEKPVPSGTKVLLRWLTTAWEREWEEEETDNETPEKS